MILKKVKPTLIPSLDHKSITSAVPQFQYLMVSISGLYVGISPFFCYCYTSRASVLVHRSVISMWSVCLMALHLCNDGIKLGFTSHSQSLLQIKKLSSLVCTCNFCCNVLVPFSSFANEFTVMNV